MRNHSQPIALAIGLALFAATPAVAEAPRFTLPLDCEAGKTCFLEQKIKMGFMKARNKLALLSDEEGRAKLAKCHPSVFEAKK